MELGGGIKKFSESMSKNYGGRLSNNEGYDRYLIVVNDILSSGGHMVSSRMSGGMVSEHYMSGGSSMQKGFHNQGVHNQGVHNQGFHNQGLYNKDALLNMFKGIESPKSIIKQDLKKKEDHPVNLIDLFKTGSVTLNQEQKQKLNKNKLTLLDLFKME